jgi:hypothetical protein
MVRFHTGTRRVVNEHDAIVVGQRGEGVGHGVLSPLPARQHLYGHAPGARCQQGMHGGGIIRSDDHGGAVLDGIEYRQRMQQHGRAKQWQILLGAVGAETCAAARGGNDNGECIHGRG